MQKQNPEAKPPRFYTANPVVFVEERIVFESCGKPSVITKYEGEAPYYIDGEEHRAVSARTIDSGKLGMTVTLENGSFANIPQERINALCECAGQIGLNHLLEAMDD